MLQGLIAFRIYLCEHSSDIGFGIEPLQYQFSFGYPCPGKQPPGAHRDAESHQGIDERRDGFHSHHPSPGIFAYPAQEIVRKKGNQDSKNNIKLVHANQFAPVFGRGNFRYIGRCCYGGGSNSQPANKPENCEGNRIVGHGRSYG